MKDRIQNELEKEEGQVTAKDLYTKLILVQLNIKSALRIGAGMSSELLRLTLEEIEPTLEQYDEEVYGIKKDKK